ncbi:MAG: CooT family nickel-binding protein [Parasporobacterium sp.]|nr:CooT family nickel-binding protein [Parasporobacterium sp.]
MCLSTVYIKKGAEREKVAEYISGVKAEGSEVTLTDVMGVETTITGFIKSMDFVKNEIIVEA